MLLRKSVDIFLQVKRSDGGYIDVPYMADAVLVNLGVLVQMWTADSYLATVSIVFAFEYSLPTHPGICFQVRISQLASSLLFTLCEQ